MNRKFSFTLMAIPLLTLAQGFSPVILVGQITLTGDHNTSYNGTDDPWHVGGDGNGDGFGDSNLSIGITDEGTLSIANGSVVTYRGSFLGDNSGGIGVVNVDGVGSQWNAQNFVGIGRDGLGVLNITNGGMASSTRSRTILGQNTGGSGFATVDGEGSYWETRELEVGSRNGAGNGIGNLAVSNGGRILSGTSYVRNGSVASIDGQGSEWSAISFSGNGDLTVSNQAVFRATSTSSRSFLGGTVIVNGNGTQWISRSGIDVEGDLTISDGAYFESYRWSILSNRGGARIVNGGIVTVDGNGSEWNNRYESIIGSNGTLNVTNRGLVRSEQGANVGHSHYASGLVNVSGVGSEWLVSGELTVGYNQDGSSYASLAQGNLNITNGGKVTSEQGSIGRRRASGMVRVDGADSEWTNTGSLYVGYFHVGNLEVTNGGSVFSNDGRVGYGAGYVGRGTVLVDGVGSQWTSTGNLEVHRLSSLTISNQGKVTVGGTLDILSGSFVDLDGGTLSVGTLNLSEDGNDFDFSDGTLNADTIIGDLVQTAGVLAPGDSPGVTEIQGNYELQSPAVVEIEIGGLLRGIEYDALDITGTSTLSGTLEITLINGFQGSIGDTFQLINSTGGILGEPTFNFDDAGLESGYGMGYQQLPE